MTRRQQRIIHQLAAEIESLHCSFVHVADECGENCPEAQKIIKKQSQYERVLADAQQTFDAINAM